MYELIEAVLVLLQSYKFKVRFDEYNAYRVTTYTLEKKDK